MKYYIIIYDGITNNKKIQKCALVPVPPLLPAKSLGDDVLTYDVCSERGRGGLPIVGPKGREVA